MNSRKITLLLGAALVAVVVFLVVKKIGGGAEETADGSVNRPSRSQGLDEQGKPSRGINQPGQSTKNNTDLVIMTPEAKAAAMKAMHEAEITYDPAQLPVIQPFLLSSDPEIRESAMDSMVNLGDASAAPMLRDAAKKLDSPKEVIALLKAAEWLELPPLDVAKMKERMKNRPKKERKPGSGAPVHRNGPIPPRERRSVPEVPRTEAPE